MYVNNTEPDQTPHDAATDLVLTYLQISLFRDAWLK